MRLQQAAKTRCIVKPHNFLTISPGQERRVPPPASTGRDHDTSSPNLEGLDQPRHRLRGHGRQIAGDDERAVPRRRQSSHSAAHGTEHVALGVGVDDELDIATDQGLTNSIAFGADDHPDAVQRAAPKFIHHPRDHRLAAQREEQFLRPHATRPAGGENDYSHYATFDTRAGEVTTVELRWPQFAASFRGRPVQAPPIRSADVAGIGLMITKDDHRDGRGPFALDLLSVEPLR